jgi:hypothetical protein
MQTQIPSIAVVIMHVLFLFQNNNRGGYNAGDKDTEAFQSEQEIYYMVCIIIYMH